MPLFRKRERFDRSDVPTASPARNVVSALVIVAVVIGMYGLVTTLWRRANQVEGLGDRSLRAVVRSQPSAAAPAEGFVSSEHDVTNTLVLVTTADGLLAQAQMLSLDRTAQTGTIVNVPLDTKLVVDDVAVSLVSCYAERGSADCVAPLASAANQQVEHVIVATADIWDQLDRLRGAELAVLLGSAADMLETINSDLSPKDLLALASEAQGIGVANLRRIDAPVTPEQLADGATLNVIDRTALGIELGTLVPAEPAGEEGAGDGEAPDAPETEYVEEYEGE